MYYSCFYICLNKNRYKLEISILKTDFRKILIIGIIRICFKVTKVTIMNMYFKFFIKLFKKSELIEIFILIYHCFYKLVIIRIFLNINL
jgi:hypothetical protein